MSYKNSWHLFYKWLYNEIAKGTTRARQRAGRPGPEIFDPEKNLILNPEPG